MKKKIFCILGLLIFLGTNVTALGVLSHPRKVYVLKTEHFDIIFPEEEMKMAKYLAENVDYLYMKAKYATSFDVDLHMPIIISPDSQVFSIEYTSYPYNRIVLYDSVPSEDQTVYDDVIFDSLYKQIFLAFGKNVTSPFNKMIRFFVGEEYTPVSLYNLPFSIVDGFYSFEDEKIKDKEVQKILAQAKYENKFPSWMQVSSIRDIYPYSELQNAVGAAFNAFLIQEYGIEKFYDFWLECGEIHPYFTEGIIKKVFKENISEIWQKFEASIPLPQDINNINENEKLVQKKFEKYQGCFNQLTETAYGYIWYDNIRHEVNISDKTKKKGVKKLFYADKIERLSVSDDGKFIVISFEKDNGNQSFPEYKTRVYDLERKKYLFPDLSLRDATIINLENGQRAIAGINVQDKIAKLQVYMVKGFDSVVTNLVYEKCFNTNQIPFSPNLYKNGYLIYILSNDSKKYLCQLNVQSGKETFYEIKTNDDNPVVFKQLKVQKKNGEQIFTFQYDIENEIAFNRIGYFSEDLSKVYLQSENVSGGISNPIFEDDKLIFISKKVFKNEMEILPSEKITFKEAKIISRANISTVYEDKYADLKIENKKLGDYSLKKYSPIKYMWPLSIIPLMSMKEIYPEDDPSLWPSLGFTIKTQADPMLNNDIIFSANWTYAKLNFDWKLNSFNNKTDLAYEEQIERKDKVVAIYYENTSTPVKIDVGSLFRCNFDGEYEFNSVIGTAWKIPLGMTFENLNFNFNTTFVASTDYYDLNLSNKYNSLSGWPGFTDAYETVKLSTGINYSNIRQCGLSKFENKGFSIGMNLICFWDIYQIKLLKKAEEDIENGSLVFEYLTPVLFRLIDKKQLAKITQMNLGFTAKIAVPDLFPIEQKNGFIFSMPTTFSAEFLNQTGTLIHFNAESLLFGKEVQNGFFPLKLYFNRFGLFAGYNFDLIYNTEITMAADIRSMNSIKEAFQNSISQNSVYLLFNMSNVIAVGKLSESIINTTFKITYFTETNGWLMSLNFAFNF